MNRPIVRLYGLVVLLFALLIAFTSRWTIFEASSLRDNPLNARALLEQERIAPRPDPRRQRHGARAQRARRGRHLRAHLPDRRSSSRRRSATPTPTSGRPGLERYRNAALNGETSAANLQAILDQLQGKRRQGDEVDHDARPARPARRRSRRSANTAARSSRSTRATGRCKVMASTPSYRPQRAALAERLRTARARARARRSSTAPPSTATRPGSTFKVVTATAAIDTGQFTPSSTLSGRNDVLVSGVPLAQRQQRELRRDHAHRGAREIGQHRLGAGRRKASASATLARYMNRFGFDRKPAARLSRRRDVRQRRVPTRADACSRPPARCVDVGRMGIGQDKLQVTPLQMAEVAAAVANHGRLMAPHLTERIVNPEGRTVQRIAPRVQSVVMKPSTAAAVTSMMEAVVNEGTGTAAQIPGVQVAGKTGTAETQIGDGDQQRLVHRLRAGRRIRRVAIAVTIKGVPGYGATFAAPVATQVMEVLLA